MPNNLKSGIENLSGYSMDDVKVHYNSSKPAQLNAHAYAQGTDIHVSPGQEQHLPHEAWHVVQQKQGRVKPTMQMKGEVPVNDNAGLEKEADVMGDKAKTSVAQLKQDTSASPSTNKSSISPVTQLKPTAFTGIITDDIKYNGSYWSKGKDNWSKLEAKVIEYATISDENMQKRNQLVEQILVLVTACNLEFTEKKLAFDTNPETAPRPTNREFKRKLWYPTLINLLATEGQEIKESKGTLDVDAGAVQADPRLTKEFSEAVENDADKKTVATGGMFKTDAEIVDNKKSKVDTGKEGKVVKVLNGWEDKDIDTKKSDYKKVTKEDKPKAGKNFQNIKDGYVKQDDLLDVNRVEDAKNLKYTEQFDPLTYPLFPHTPKKEDVVQVGLGDCYFLAALISVVNKSPAHFRSHMKDHGDGTVTVKLYKDIGQAKNVTIKKSVVMTDSYFNSQDAFAGGALWAKLYEKAYVAAGFYGSDGTLPSLEQSYGMIEGGNTAVAQTHLTGKKSTLHTINTGREDISGQLVGITKEVVKKMDFKKPESMTQLNKLQVEVPKKLTPLLEKTFVTQEDLRKMLVAEGVAQQYIKQIMDQVCAKKLMTGALGSGIYSQGELDLFKGIKDKLDNGKMMTLHTRHDIFDSKDEVEEKGGSAGESMVKGLAGPHAYALLDYGPKNPKAGQTLSLLIRNPWGEYGRGYRDATTKAKASNETGAKFEGAERYALRGAGSGEFWIDLADIAAYFTGYAEM